MSLSTILHLESNNFTQKNIPAGSFLGESMGNGSVQLLFLILALLLDTIKLGSCSNNFTVSCIELEKKSLLKFKQSLADPSGRLSSWTGDDCCQWRGVSCNTKTGHVVQLQLQNPFPKSSDGSEMLYELGGQINPSIADLKYLNHLDLSTNNFRGTQIPKFLGSLIKLRYLNLSSSSFSGRIPSNIGNLSQLRYLDLSSYTDEPVANDLRWLSGLLSLRYLNLGGLDLSRTASYWLQSINMLPFLSELHLPQSQLLNLPLHLPSVNFTSLKVLDLSNNAFNSTMPDWLFNLSTLAHLDLSKNNIHGMLPDALAILSSLQTLDLSSNFGIQGRLSRQLGNLCKLEMLALTYNNISGGITEFIEGISECTNSSLQTLDLGYNELTGNLPRSLGSLKSLRHLRLRENSLTGSIPETIGNLSSLEQLYLADNQMSGSIPKSFGKLSSLVALDLYKNSWEGVITETHLMNLSSLQEISIGRFSRNISLVFNISPDWVPPFKLKYMKIQSCQLGPKFPTWLKNQNELITVVINFARISDSIPDWFLNLGLRLIELDVAYNNLSGKLPNSLQFGYQSNVDLSSNRFEGPLPLWSSNISTLYLRDNLFSGPIPTNIGQAMPSLTDLDISRNSLNGSIPLSIGNLTGLLTLVISNNQLSGDIPQFWDNITSLLILDMSNNSLSGTIPKSIGSLTGLRFLILSGNNLSGKLPSSLRNCSHIVSLDLGDNKFSGTLPAWIGESMPSLLILSMRNNLLTENVPSQICSLSKLHILDLSNNNVSGIIPSCLGDLSGFKSELKPEDTSQYQGLLQVVAKGRFLQYDSTLYLVNSIDLSNNNLSGSIPAEIMNLFKLSTLNLSMNHLTGRIPVSVGSLNWLETLDLSMNQLSGPIPQTMAAMTFLNHMNLSHNNLSGKIPTGNQFQTLNDPSIYMGNIALCGYPLSIQCGNNTNAPSPGDNEGNGDKEELENLWFFLLIGFGYFLGFWGVCGCLILNKKWRFAYFRFVEGIISRLKGIFF